jgi:hypothetical protein
VSNQKKNVGYSLFLIINGASNVRSVLCAANGLKCLQYKLDTNSVALSWKGFRLYDLIYTVVNVSENRWDRLSNVNVGHKILFLYLIMLLSTSQSEPIIYL